MLLCISWTVLYIYIWLHWRRTKGTTRISQETVDRLFVCVRRRLQSKESNRQYKQSAIYSVIAHTPLHIPYDIIVIWYAFYIMRFEFVCVSPFSFFKCCMLISYKATSMMHYTNNNNNIMPTERRVQHMCGVEREYFAIHLNQFWWRISTSKCTYNKLYQCRIEVPDGSLIWHFLFIFLTWPWFYCL